MNTEIKRITKLIERHWNGVMWHGSNLAETLKDISWQQAFAKPEKASHNIYEYVCHMSTWRRFTVEQIKGNSDYRIELNSPEDWPTQYDTSEANWQKALQELENDQADLIASLAHMTDEKLEELVPGRKFKWYVLLHGMIHHDIYHSAQIAVLKKQTT
jgi:uncharacterized damage-inducible protein DinB